MFQEVIECKLYYLSDTYCNLIWKAIFFTFFLFQANSEILSYLLASNNAMKKTKAWMVLNNLEEKEEVFHEAM